MVFITDSHSPLDWFLYSFLCISTIENIKHWVLIRRNPRHADSADNIWKYKSDVINQSEFTSISLNSGNIRGSGPVKIKSQSRIEKLLLIFVICVYNIYVLYVKLRPFLVKLSAPLRTHQDIIIPLST